MDRSNLWAPWRYEYISRVSNTEASACFLCDSWADAAHDADRLVVHRTPGAMILLNRYPYVNGHLMVCLGEHLADLPQFTPAQRAELMELTCLAERLLQKAYNPHGVNIGINVGRCAGAGLPGHLHVHVVPRWNGDTNFMDVVGHVRVIPQALQAVHEELTAAAAKLV